MTLGGNLSINQRTLTNNGIIRWTDSTIMMDNGATINNTALGTFVVECHAPISSNPGAATFNNYGVFRKINPGGGGPGTTDLFVTFNSLASGAANSWVDIQFAFVRFRRSGTFKANVLVAAGATAQFGAAMQT